MPLERMAACLAGPGQTLGILGGGQLARMMALAAAPLGIRCHIYAAEDEIPAADVCATVTRAAWDDAAALARFAASANMVTCEWENVPAATLAILEPLVPVRPGHRAFEIAQDRVEEKRFVETLGGRPAPWVQVDTLADLEAGLAQLGLPAILKTRRMGYDGKGQIRINRAEDAAAAFADLGRHDLVLEALVRFRGEFSVLVARGTDGRTKAWPAVCNIHESGILVRSEAPAKGLAPTSVDKAIALSERIAAALDYVGVLACEFFDTEDGPHFNEMAPRVHNSGHWTIEGSETSQFEQHVRAVCGLPLGETAMRAPAVMMDNLLGDAIHSWESLLARGGHLHIYGKHHAAPGRKMGHVTWLLRD